MSETVTVGEIYTRNHDEREAGSDLGVLIVCALENITVISNYSAVNTSVSSPFEM